MAVIELKASDRELEVEEEAFGFWCETEGYFIHEDQFTNHEGEFLSSVDTEVNTCPNCGEPGLIPVKVVQRNA